MNRVQLIGRLTKDPELRYTDKNIAICSFTIAINRINEESDFIPIKVFNKLAENSFKYLKKGSLVGIVGSIKTSNYEKDGKKIYKTEIIANSVEFLSNNTNSQGKEKQAKKDLQNSVKNDISDEVFKEFGESIEISDDGIAF